MKNEIVKIFDNSTNFAFCTLDSNGMIIRANNFFKKAFNFQNFSDISFFNSISWNESHVIDKVKNDLHSSDFSNETIEMSLTDEWEHTSWYSWEMIRYNDPDGTPIFYCIAQDISRGKKQQHAAVVHRLSINFLKEAIVSTDIDFKIRVWNRQAENLFQFKSGEAIGKTLDEIIVFDPVLKNLNIDFLLLKRNGFIEKTFEFTLSGGTVVILNAKLFPVTTPSNTILGFTFIFSDETARIQLANKEKVLRSFLNNSSALAWIVNEDGTIEFMNSLAQQTYQLESDPAGKNLMEIMPIETAKRYISDNKKLIEANKVEEREDEELRPDGISCVYHTIEFPIVYSEGEKMCAGLAFDISEIKRMQKQLVEHEQLKNQEIIQVITKVEESERSELYELLHENVAQVLSASKMFLQSIDPSKFHKKDADQLNQNLEIVIRYLQKASYLLRPSLLTDLGLAEALKELKNYYTRPGSLSIEIVISRKMQKHLFNESIQLMIFEMAKLYLSNCTRCTDATYSKIMVGIKDNFYRIEFFDDRKIDKTKGFEETRKEAIHQKIKSFNGVITEDIVMDDYGLKKGRHQTVCLPLEGRLKKIKSEEIMH